MFESTTTKSSSPVAKTKGKAHKAHKTSSGKRRARVLNREMSFLTRKVARWEKNKAEGKKSAIERKGSNAKKPQRLGGKVASRVTWNTFGMQRQIAAMDDALHMRKPEA